MIFSHCDPSVIACFSHIAKLCKLLVTISENVKPNDIKQHNKYTDF